jgi:carboxylesterase type B
VYGACNPASQACQVMTDYWISFATSLDPNDQKGTSRPQWAAYSQNSPVSCLVQEATYVADLPIECSSAEQHKHKQCL